jgi:hypothetical protein
MDIGSLLKALHRSAAWAVVVMVEPDGLNRLILSRDMWPQLQLKSGILGVFPRPCLPSSTREASGSMCGSRSSELRGSSEQWRGAGGRVPDRLKQTTQQPGPDAEHERITSGTARRSLRTTSDQDGDDGRLLKGGTRRASYAGGLINDGAQHGEHGRGRTWTRRTLQSRRSVGWTRIESYTGGRRAATECSMAA